MNIVIRFSGFFFLLILVLQIAMAIFGYILEPTPKHYESDAKLLAFNKNPKKMGYKGKKEGDVIPAGTILGYQGASGRSDPMDGTNNPYPHISLHVNGVGFKATEMYGSEHNDPYTIKNKKVITKTNNAGGIIGGISTGMPIKFNVAIKPTASIGIEQHTINLKGLTDSRIKIEGRHDPCIVPRAVPVIEAMSAVVIVDLMIGNGNIPKVLSR